MHTMKNNVILPVLKRTPSKDAFLSLSHFMILHAIFQRKRRHIQEKRN